MDRAERLAGFRIHVSGFRSPRTVLTYCSVIKLFEDYLARQGLHVDVLSPRILDDFYRSFGDQIAPSTVRLYVAAVRKYLGWLRSVGRPIPELEVPQLPRVEEPLRSPIQDEAFAKILQACHREREPYRTAIIILALTGVRVTELCSLTAEDVVPTPEGYTLLVRKAKGGRARAVPLMRAGTSPFRHYLRVTWRQLADTQWLFPMPDHDRAITTVVLRRHLKVVGLRAGLSRLTPHMLRHAYLTHLHRHGLSVIEIGVIAGHRDLNTTRKYVHVSLPELRARLDQLPAPWERGTNP